MLEAQCTRCKEIFIPHSAAPSDVIHGITELSDECGGIGIILGEWVPPQGVMLFDFGDLKNLTMQELHGAEEPNCDDPTCGYHHPEILDDQVRS